MSGLYTEHLDAMDPESLIVTYPKTMTRDQALAAAKKSPSNAEVLAACKDAYHQHTPAVDDTTTGSIATAKNPANRQDVAASQAYNWHSKVAAPNLTQPLLAASDMGAARKSVETDGDFATFFVGIEANLDVFVGGFGGVGVGFGFPSGSPLWMAWGGIRISMNIDVGINLTAGIFVEPPAKVAGDFIGIEVSCEPVYEGPSIGFGIHLSTDLSEIRGFSVAVGAELGLLPVNAAIEYGHIVTN
ncbi:hypothetical protein [Leekyejoonella antrihumi]|uniref:Uncharacterized protein n=1 Tax=Leekyejoonella antrihumi TaxID=1660198 RepID=A0A563E1S8_9MICO|nr:hypothetical protein [Leekyejoonella antrihumi]TWP36161.1 hypothetical protein FGL98_10690 [Leekyejoonella antrihumi]